ncbi:MAG: hypothetical protein HYY24_08450 [Verrucomicrobia bacterium]|nr:hypothetical protein [Verrucomicrobiota bacterium]
MSWTTTFCRMLPRTKPPPACETTMTTNCTARSEATCRKTGGGDKPPDNAVLHDSSVSRVKVLNNQKSVGEFLPAFNSTTGRHDWERTNKAEDAFLVR